MKVEYLHKKLKYCCLKQLEI